MKELRLPALCWSLLFSAVIAAPPTPVVTTTIEEGQEIVPGDIVLFDASGTLDATGFKWAVVPAKFPDSRPTHEVSADGKSVRLATRPGYYMLILAITNKESEISLLKRDVTVGKVTPQPGPVGPIKPEPIKPEPVKPSFPDEDFGMSTAAYEAAAIGGLNKTQFKALSLAFRQIGGAAAAGGFNSLKEIQVASKDANMKAICGNIDVNSDQGKAIRTASLPFFTALQPKIVELSQNKAALPADYGKMLIEIGVGIEAASK